MNLGPGRTSGRGKQRRDFNDLNIPLSLHLCSIRDLLHSIPHYRTVPSLTPHKPKGHVLLDCRPGRPLREWAEHLEFREEELRSTDERESLA
jgi:hypothetical protein